MVSGPEWTLRATRRAANLTPRRNHFTVALFHDRAFARFHSPIPGPVRRLARRARLAGRRPPAAFRSRPPPPPLLQPAVRRPPPRFPRRQRPGRPGRRPRPPPHRPLRRSQRRPPRRPVRPKGMQQRNWQRNPSSRNRSRPAPTPPARAIPTAPSSHATRSGSANPLLPRPRRPTRRPRPSQSRST
jgi:hypothetical protein